MSKVLVTEYFLSTYASDKPGKQLLAEAYGMVSALSDTIRNAGADVIVTISRYLADAVEVPKKIEVDIDRYFDTLDRLKSYVDIVIAIAPPPELITIAELVGERLLGPSPRLIKILSDKYESTAILRSCGIDTPYTLLCTDSEGYSINHLSFPIVVKPSMMAGAECVYIARNVDEVKKYVNIVRGCDPQGRVVIQEYIKGVHGSISTIFISNMLKLFSLNLQLMAVRDNKLEFYGNILPVRSSKWISKASEIVMRMSRCLYGLNGYIGFDVVWNETGMYVVEVNPRFTTSGIAMATVLQELGKVMLGGIDWEFKYLGEVVSGYSYVVKKAVECHDVGLCLRGLAIGIAENVHDVMEDIEKINPEALRFLPYSILNALS